MPAATIAPVVVRLILSQVTGPVWMCFGMVMDSKWGSSCRCTSVCYRAVVRSSIAQEGIVRCIDEGLEAWYDTVPLLCVNDDRD